MTGLSKGIIEIEELEINRVTTSYLFYKWTAGNVELPDSAFTPYREQVIYAHSSAVLSSINNIYHVFANHRILFLLPVVMILLVLGLVFFFISANSVFSFVYALF